MNNNKYNLTNKSFSCNIITDPDDVITGGHSLYQ